MKRTLLSWVFASLCASMGVVATSHAAMKSSEPKPKIATPKIGQYLTERGWGVLDVLQGKEGKRIFRLNSLGTNGHSCTLEGVIENGIAILNDDPATVCKVSFAPTPFGVAVADATNGMCRSYCGARAGFEGSYSVPALGCSTQAVRASREKFKQAYDKKQYAEAELYLSPILSRCAITLDQWADSDIRNDLGITYFHLKNKSACLSTLAPLAKLAGDDDATIKDEYSYAPSDAEGMVNMAKAARVNLKKCNSL